MKRARMAIGVYMEVNKLVLSTLAAFIFVVVGCSDKKSAGSVTEPLSKGDGTTTCPAEALLKSQFIVKYEDGTVGVIRAENAQVLVKNFVEPNLEKIKRVEYDSIVTLNEPELTEEQEVLAQLTADDWGQGMIRAPQVWSQGVLGEGVTVAVIDAAVDITHPQLKNQFAINEAEAMGVAGKDDDNNGYDDDVSGWDFIANGPPQEIQNKEDYHGSHVAGIIAADPSAGNFSGIAPKAKILQASFLDQTHGSVGGAILAMQYAASRGAKVINASWGGPMCSESLREAVAELAQKDILFVVAAGNDGYDYDRLGPISYQYPAVFNFPHMISVAASDLKDYLTNFSNRSFSFVHIGAPGDNIRSTVPYIKDASGYKFIPGTSMAAPFVSGAAALLWSAKPKATVSQIRQALLSSTDYRAYKVSSQGRLNVEKALDEIRRIVP